MIDCLPVDFAVANLMDPAIAEVRDDGMATGEHDSRKGSSLPSQRSVRQNTLAPEALCCKHGGSQLSARGRLQT